MTKRAAPALEGFLFGSDDEDEGRTPAFSSTHEIKKESNENAWQDSDDENMEVDISKIRRLKKLRKEETDEIVSGLEYEQRLRERFMKMHGGKAKWATADQGSDSEDDNVADLFQTTAKLIVSEKGGPIPATKLNIKRETDVTTTKHGNAVVQAVQFHPDSEIIMSCGYDKTLRLYHVDNDENPVIGSYHFPNFPLSDGIFTSDGSACILTGLSRNVWRFDVETGQARRIVLGGRSFKKVHSIVQGGNNGFLGLGADNGNAVIIDEKTNKVTKVVKMNAETKGIAFHPHKNSFYTADAEAYLYEWDLRNGKCITRFRDDAAVACTTLALSPNGSQLAVGTQSGIVDLFDTSGPKLSDHIIKSIDNLQTPVSSMRFHPDSEVLAIASKFEKRALRLLHTPTSTVYQNWPTETVPIKRPTALDFSRHGGKFAIGGSNGKVLLFSLNHYQ